MVMKPRRGNNFRRVFPATLLALLVCGCDIFSPRPSQTPKLNTTTDPFDFSAIGGTQYPLATLQYQDLFQGDDPIYFDENSGPSTKAVLIPRLNQIVNAYQHIQVNWTGVTSIVNIPDSLVTVTVGKYDIILNTSTDPTMTANDSGTATFTLVYSAGWRIGSWKDYPAGQGASFFSPNYSQ